MLILKEIIVSGAQVAETDFTINLPEMSTDEKLLYFKALGNILMRDNRSLTELYQMVKRRAQMLLLQMLHQEKALRQFLMKLK